MGHRPITGEYEEFKNLRFVDTLDNVGLHTSAVGVTHDPFGSVSEENVARIKRQNLVAVQPTRQRFSSTDRHTTHKGI